jgi:thiosulfate/3-mercaptopyruvate sulfurtransferase
MKKGIIVLFIAIAAFTVKQTEPWTPEQLMPPEDLAAVINNPAAVKPLIICVGPSGVIRGSVEAGPANEAQNLDKLKKLVAKEDRKREVVIYCGCCPFIKCPNVRPAFSLLTSMKFTNLKLLNLAHNIKIDWIAQGYPVH